MIRIEHGMLILFRCKESMGSSMVVAFLTTKVQYWQLCTPVADIALRKQLAADVVFLIEGEEESGSRGFRECY